MDKKLLLSIVLTVGAFVVTVCLFIVTVIQKDSASTVHSSEAIITGPARQQEESQHPGAKIFNANCKSCHRIHQQLIGPALAGVLDRRDSLWVIQMIRNSSKLIASGDPTAVELFNQYNKTQMTSFSSFSDEELEQLLQYLRIESARKQEPLPAPSRTEV